MSVFSSINDSTVDPIILLMSAYAQDTHPKKIDVSVGVYKTEDGNPDYIFPCVREAKKILAANDPGHCYTLMSGIPAFTQAAQKTIFGANYPNVCSVQAVSGSGALHLAFMFLREIGFNDFHVGVPAWGNYEGMIKHAGGNFIPFQHYDAATNLVDFDLAVEALETAPPKSVFVLQAVCHNPTGCDYTKEQWLQILDIIQKKNIFPLFDIAYQGFSSGSVDDDAWVVRESHRRNMEFVVCQSYSKNLGLYSERAGCIHVSVQDESAVPKVKDLLVSLVRSEFSFAPAFGARVATIVQTDEELQKVWAQDVLDVTLRLKHVRQKLLDTFTRLQTPGNWEPVIKQNGLFWFTGLTAAQTKLLLEEHHIYGTANGRVNVAGLNDSNIETYCRAVDDVVRKCPFEQ